MRIQAVKTPTQRKKRRQTTGILIHPMNAPQRSYHSHLISFPPRMIDRPNVEALPNRTQKEEQSRPARRFRQSSNNGTSVPLPSASGTRFLFFFLPFNCGPLRRQAVPSRKLHDLQASVAGAAVEAEVRSIWTETRQKICVTHNCSGETRSDIPTYY